MASEDKHTTSSSLHSPPSFRNPTKISFDLPERFKHPDDDGEDVTAPKTKRGRIMNQSFISMIASVGLSSNLNSEFSTTSGDTTDARQINPNEAGRPGRALPSPELDRIVSNNEPRPRNKALDHRMLQSSPGLYRRQARRKHHNSLDDTMITSQILTPPPPSLPAESLRAPSQLSMEAEPPAFEPEPHTHIPGDSIATVAGDATEDATEPHSPEAFLAERIASMFGFEHEEEVNAEYLCCLLQDIPVHGYLYVLEKHICFYAYLPKETSVISKSGYLYKRGRQNPKYNRYWFVLKGNVLYYYLKREEQYFPRGTIPLHSGVSVELDASKEPSDSSISVKFSGSIYHFRAETALSAQDWINKLRKAAFRAQNEAESIKISFPIENILDIEDSSITEATQMLKIKVIDNDETFTVDEYFFSLSGCGPEELQMIRAIIRNERHTVAAGEFDDDGLPMEEIALDRRKGIQGSEELRSSTADPSSSSITGAKEEIASPVSLVSPDSRYFKSHATLSSSTSSSRPSVSALRATDSFPAVQDLYKAGADRLRQASVIAGSLGSQSRRVGNMLARESKGYYERVYSMWAGKRTHYDDKEDPLYEQSTDHEGERHGDTPGDRFRKHFALPPSEKLQASYYSYLHRVLPIYGKIYVGSNKVCFRSLMPGTRTKMILPFRDIENVAQEKGFSFGHYGLVVIIRGHEEIFFEFRDTVGRDDCAITLLQILDSVKQLEDSRMLSQEATLDIAAARAEHDLLQKARRGSRDINNQLSASDTSQTDAAMETVIFDDNLASIVDFKPTGSLKITCLTIGSRGDVQPYIALCKGLLEEGHRPTIATHAEFESWIRSHGIDFQLVAGNPAKIMQLCVENDMFTVAFLREAQKFRGFINELLESSWKACQGADILIESPSAMGGIHIAEALEIPYYRAFTMPWTRTRAYPHAFAVMNQKMGGNWNWYSYVLFDVGFWQGISNQINTWRAKLLNLPPTSLKKMQADKVPFMYNFSPSVVAPPLDFSHQVHITGYWFLDEGVDYEPPAKLLAFLEKAKEDGKKVVYVGFGSVTVEDPVALTRAVSEAVRDADVRCILCKGWSDRLDNKNASVPEIPLHDSIFQIPGAPHDWLFKQVDAAVHHGGAGTTGASLRAGIPTIVKPFFGDQHFFASRVEDLGVGRCLKNINSRSLARALVETTHNERIIMRAKVVGEQIRSEDGVANAIQTIYRNLEYARSLIKRRDQPTHQESTEELEESWTLVEDDSDPDVLRRSAGLEFQASLAQLQRRSGLDEDSTASARSSDGDASSDDEDDEPGDGRDD